MSKNFYHERQVKELCAIHAINNLFQQKLFTKNDFDGICEELSPSKWFNPHRSMLGTGNFDINIIMSALQSKGYAGKWFDKRKDPQTLNLKVIKGLIMNTPNPYELGMIRLPFNRRHWFAITKVGDVYYNLDSKLVAPAAIGDENNLIAYLQTELRSEGRELFIVVDQDIEKNGSWICSDSDALERTSV